MENGFTGRDGTRRPGHVFDHADGEGEWGEILARTVAHLAAQLTVTQLRLRALASELSDNDADVTAAVRERLRTLAASESGTYLRANLGEALAEVIDIQDLERNVIAYLTTDDGQP
ncbi:MAG TPA: hypothetical protein VGR16_04020 [Thermomicrobiales bacterium]|nr:hypothetical protein [Thermomicrobiales bacterium]